MVEKTHTAGWLPDLYEPLRNIGRKVANWFAPKSEASASQDSYRIVMELPGVEVDDVQNGILTVTIAKLKASQGKHSSVKINVK